jgi:hypothetical protein
MAANPEGSIEFWAGKKMPAKWFSDANGYKFPEITGLGVTVAAVKNPDRTYVVTISGLPQGTVRLAHETPVCDSRGLQTVVTWSPTRITLFLNGREVEHMEIQTH